MASTLRSSLLPRASFAGNIASRQNVHASRRSFQRCTILGVGKESAVRTFFLSILQNDPRLEAGLDCQGEEEEELTDIPDDENRAEKVEAEKQDQLAKQKQGNAQWNDELASDSESIVGLCTPALVPCRRDCR